MNATQCIEESLKPEKISLGSASWRNSHFKPGEALPCGCLNFSPVAFPLGHTVCLLAPASTVKAEDGTPTEHRGTHHLTDITDQGRPSMDERDSAC